MRELLNEVNEMDSVMLDNIRFSKKDIRTLVLVLGSKSYPVVVKSVGRSKIYEVVKQPNGSIIFQHLPKAGILYSVSHLKGYNEDSTMSSMTRKLVSVDLYEKKYRKK